MAPHPGDDSQTQSSTLEPFPPLSSSQRNLINHTLALLAHDAHTWADLTHAQGVLQRDGHASADEIARLYEVWLRMVWVEGTTWHDKWDAVQRQWAEAEGVNGTNAATPVANRRNHRRRPSDNLDLLRRKLDAVELDTPQQPSSAPRPLPPRTRPKSTPPRQLLVRPAQQAGGYSSSDDQFVGNEYLFLRQTTMHPAKQPAAVASPPQRLTKLLMPLFAHWSARVRFWVGRFKRIREGREKAEEWRNERDERRLSKAGRRRALGGAFAMWREKWITRVETRQAAEREEARREKEAALREARDAVLSLRYRGLAVRSLREWRIRCATKRVEKVVGAGLARRAVEKWVRRVGEVKHRAEVMEEIADEKWAESEEGRKREKWGWWVRRTALRVKEAELVGAKEDALRREGWEWWREMKQRRDHVCHLEQVASAHDARHLALQSLSTWRNRTARLAFLSSLASTHAHTLLTRRASSQLTHWRLSLRLRLALRIRADSLLSTSLSHWLDAYEHVQIELEGRADALIATRDARVGGVALEVWRNWLVQLRQRRRDRELVTQLQRQQAQRLLAASMEQWKLAVVVRREEEVEARDWRDHKLVRDGFRRWAQQTVKAEERILRSASFRAVKLEELRDRLFHAWLSSSRRSAALRERLVRFDASRRGKTLEASFDRWRECSLQRPEEQVQRCRAQRERQEAWERWKSRTKTLAAIQHYNRILASHALSAWQAWTPPADLTRRAVEADEGSVIGGAFQVWKIKTGAKKALRSYRCARSTAHAFGCELTIRELLQRSPASRIFTNCRLTFARLASSPLSGSSFLKYLIDTLQHAFPFRLGHIGCVCIDGCDELSSHACDLRVTPSTSAFTSAASRRRLSAEIAVNKPSAPRQPDEAKRERRRSIVSVLSSRSAPSGGASLFASRVSGIYDDSDEEDTASVGREGKSTRSEGGADVRGRHEALRARLRAAAAAASSSHRESFMTRLRLSAALFCVFLASFRSSQDSHYNATLGPCSPLQFISALFPRSRRLSSSSVPLDSPPPPPPTSTNLGQRRQHAAGDVPPPPTLSAAAGRRGRRSSAPVGSTSHQQLLKGLPAPPKQATEHALGGGAERVRKGSERASAKMAKEAEGIDDTRVYRVVATDASNNKQVELAFVHTAAAGHGSFGVVFRGELVRGGHGVVAFKRTRQDKRFKNRELQIMSAVSHPNIVMMLFYWYESAQDEGDSIVVLNLVLEFLPETLYRAYRTYTKRRQYFPEISTKLYMYQLLRALAYLHAVGVCHRDVKPHNVLVDADSGRLVLIDFGSAKVLREGVENVSYACSRYYRAPELIFGSTRYNDSIDVWSAGCVLGELLCGSVFFPGESSIDQLVEIVKVLGTPTREHVKAMNAHYTEHNFPQVQAVPLEQILPRASAAAIDLLGSLILYDPSRRLTAIEAMAHHFFDDLRRGNMRESNGSWGVQMPNGKCVTVGLFDFSKFELSIRPDLNTILVPPHARQALLIEQDVDLETFIPLDLDAHRLNLD
uniref:BY PROTMAP: gi/342321175/gb/EGU13110.1/ CMGC/GSK protein kinase [Rhodotorula glutinis ATCC 204091] n=1 Tax=Rhodotorula toruloides TaxID=5286 RepID=A0A0K3CN92_RHOTO